MVSILMAVGAGLVLASFASAASVHAQANNTSSSSGAAKNMTSAAPSAAGNITRVIVTLECCSLEASTTFYDAF